MMKWRDVFGLMGMLFLISVMSWGYAFWTSTEAQDKTFAFFEKMKSECPACATPMPTVCPEQPSCGKQCAELMTATPSDVRRVYLSNEATDNVVLYKKLSKSWPTEATRIIQTRRKIISTLGTDDLLLVQKNNEQCAVYEFFIGIDRPFIEFTECSDRLQQKK